MNRVSKSSAIWWMTLIKKDSLVLKEQCLISPWNFLSNKWFTNEKKYFNITSFPEIRHCSFRTGFIPFCGTYLLTYFCTWIMQNTMERGKFSPREISNFNPFSRDTCFLNFYSILSQNRYFLKICVRILLQDDLYSIVHIKWLKKMA